MTEDRINDIKASYSNMVYYARNDSIFTKKELKGFLDYTRKHHQKMLDAL